MDRSHQERLYHVALHLVTRTIGLVVRVPRLILLLLACLATARAGDAPTLRIVNATVVDVATGELHRGATIVVQGNRIMSVGGATTAIVGQVVDAKGSYVIPGLWDMHTHAFFGDRTPESRDLILPLFIANGVTGIRDMGSSLEPVLSARADVAAHRLLGPRMIVSGPMLDGPKVSFPASIAITSAAVGRDAVDSLERRGVDFIKIQSYVPRDAYFAIAEECQRRGLVFAGHVPDAVRGAEAASSGQKSFEHLIGIFEGSSTAEDALLAGGKTPGKFLATYDAGREAALIQLLAGRQIWQCPTLYWERGQWLVDAIDVGRDPDARYAPVSWRDRSWPRFTASILRDLDTDPLDVRQRFVDHELGIVRRLHAAGVPLLAGTDTPAGVDVIPGVSLHRELARLVDAGLTPLAALQAATINPARFLGRLAELGTVEPGKLADLVVLDRDPRLDIAGTRAIAAVITAGRYLSRAELDAMLRNIATASQTL